MLTSKERQAALRKRRAALGQKEIRNIWATNAEEKLLKPMRKDFLTKNALENAEEKLASCTAAQKNDDLTEGEFLNL